MAFLILRSDGVDVGRMTIAIFLSFGLGGAELS
jgi:hypothetical protein